MEGELSALRRSLDNQRAHVLGILDGLSDEQLGRPVLPSGWSALGLVRHLALDVEHYWFGCIIGGESLGAPDEGSPDEPGAWVVPPGVSGEEIAALYRDEIERANAIIATTRSEAPPAQRDQWWGEWEVPDVRFILLHVITETACHAGHLDAACELIDGRQWTVL